jgi:hypothetical protein
MERTRLRCEQDKAFYGVVRRAGERMLAAPPAAAGGSGLATWLWDTLAVASSPAELDRLTEFCRRNGVEAAYVSMNAAARANLRGGSGLGDALAQLAASGVRVSALLAENSWALPDGRTALEEAVDDLTAVGDAGHITGIHLDIEPHALAEWDEAGGPEALVRDLADAVEAVRRRMQEAGADLKLEVDVPVFYDRVAPEELRRIMAAADGIVLMAYEVTDLERVISSVEPELEMGRDTGCEVRVALRAADWPTAEALAGAIGKLQAAFAERVAFAGVAVHDYTDWAGMPEDNDDAPEG